MLNANNWHFKMPTIDILTFMSMIHFMLSYVAHEKEGTKVARAGKNIELTDAYDMMLLSSSSRKGPLWHILTIKNQRMYTFPEQHFSTLLHNHT